MTRRGIFSTIRNAALVFAGGVYASCVKAADSWFYWPGRPSTSALKRHLKGKPHYFDSRTVDSWSRSEAIKRHDDHHFKMGSKPPLKKTAQAPSDPKTDLISAYKGE